MSLTQQDWILWSCGSSDRLEILIIDLPILSTTKSIAICFISKVPPWNLHLLSANFNCCYVYIYAEIYLNLASSSNTYRGLNKVLLSFLRIYSYRRIARHLGNHSLQRAWHCQIVIESKQKQIVYIINITSKGNVCYSLIILWLHNFNCL